EDLTGQPMVLVGATATSAAYTGVYSRGGANVTVNRSYELVPGTDALKITQNFVNHGADIVLRCFDTYDPDMEVGFVSFFDMFADRYVLSTNGLNIQMGRGIMTNVVMTVIQATT